VKRNKIEERPESDMTSNIRTLAMFTILSTYKRKSNGYIDLKYSKSSHGQPAMGGPPV
jgi:hypothetical protein